MNISIHFLWISILYGRSFASITEGSSCRAAVEPDELCEELIFQSVTPILKNVQENVERISQLKAELNLNNQTLRENQKSLHENQNEIKRLKEIIQLKDQEVSKLREEIKKIEEKRTNCTSYGVSNDVSIVKLPNFEHFPALCNSDIAGPGWTIIQQRINGGEEFNKNWEAYKNGFGSLAGDFFLGLEKIHLLTKDSPHELYIHMEAFEEGIYEIYETIRFHARYDNFSIAGEHDKYRLLSLGSYSGNAYKDRMRDSENQQFSTFDKDNDESGLNCAEDRRGGWWYKNCADCNLNGKYYQVAVEKEDSNWWIHLYSLKTIKMMIRPRGN